MHRLFHPKRDYVWAERSAAVNIWLEVGSDLIVSFKKALYCPLLKQKQHLSFPLSSESAKTYYALGVDATLKVVLFFSNQFHNQSGF